MRDRLVELVVQAREDCTSTSCFQCEYRDKEMPKDCFPRLIADHLLANGVIVPPCKVGDTVYYFYEGGEKVYEGVVTSFVYVSGTKSFILHCDGVYGRYGRYFFLTSEEAERALKGGE